MIKYILPILVGLLLFTACDNTLDINAPYRETPVVYAVIDLGQDSQIFRIQKTYQNDVNKTAAEIAQYADSLYMKNITVKVVNDNNQNLFTEFKRVAPRKEAGYFSNADSSYWGHLTTNFFTANQRYTLRIKSNETGNEYIATTTACGKADIQLLAAIDLNPSVSNSFTYQITKLGDNIYTFDVYIRLKYWEKSTNSNDTITRYVDYFLRENTLYSTTNGTLRITVNRQAFLDYLKANIAVNANATRGFSNFEYIVVGSNIDYNDMIETNKPSGSIIPKVSDYSNITNGIGVFASRTTSVKEQPLKSTSIDLLNTEILNRP
ncbi:MAG: DUF4249 family protein [Bacteroidia bacterium]|nr:DUF4249 family protein [Bacteroidia bacterium]MBP9689153.1 DUF4249 family protein [Bacteroidia bacterium]